MLQNIIKLKFSLFLKPKYKLSTFVYQFQLDNFKTFIYIQHVYFTMKHTDYIHTLSSYFEYKDVLDIHTIYFYKSYLQINNDKIPYSSLTKVSKYKTGLRILIIPNVVLDIPCDQDLKREIFTFFKSLSENTEKVQLSHILGTAILHFGKYTFLINFFDTSYDEFRKTILKRLSFYFFPKQQTNINVEEFNEFKFYIKDKNNIIPIENSSDLGSALFHYNYRLNVYIKHK